ncbi:MAG: LysE family transporter [Flavobacteriaceae bacterium]|nr:LysE family transporter [Flavobacteriaceae bacterium]
MMLVLTFILGLIAAFIGLIPPSMLNMTAIKISTTKGKSKAVNYAIGVSATVLIQATLALLITKLLEENDHLLVYVNEVASFIFIMLSVYFFRKGFSERKANYTNKQKIKSNFITGLLLSFLNMFAIPYYCGVGSALVMSGYLLFDKLSILFFVTGAALGTFLILYMYIYTAQKVLNKLQGFTKNINFILSAITGLLGIITLIKLF